MKRTLFALSCLLLTLNSYASHLMGGQITAAWLGTGYDYQITMTLYRDTVGIPMYPSEYVMISSDTVAGSNAVTDTLLVPSATNFGNGVEEYTYQFNYTFSAPGDYIIYWSNCCRNAAILNLPSPSSNSMLLFTKLHVDTANSSPVFLNPPIPIAQVGVPFTYNSLPFDADGDSIAWRLDVPLDQSTGSLYVPITGYVDPFSDTTQPFALNPTTSEISFLPNTLGHFVVSLAVDEFRAGVKIGEIRRDMQIIVVGPSNSPRLFNYTSNIPPTSGRTIRFNPNTTLHLIVTASDPTDNDPLSIEANGRAFLLSNNPPVFSSSINNGTVTGDLSWTPIIDQGSNQPYVTCFRVAESHGGYMFFLDETFEIYVNRSVGIDDPSSYLTDRWNLSNGMLTGFLKLTERSDVSIELMNISGQLVRTLHNNFLTAGDHQFVFPTNELNSGIYLVRTTINGKYSHTTKLLN